MIVDGLGIAKYFGQVITSAAIGYEKPNPKAYGALLEQIDASDTVCMIGDNYTADVLGARRVAWMRYGCGAAM
jgi:putative hydrolase of the HAD superfamily